MAFSTFELPYLEEWRDLPLLGGSYITHDHFQRLVARLAHDGARLHNCVGWISTEQLSALFKLVQPLLNLAPFFSAAPSREILFTVSVSAQIMPSI